MTRQRGRYREERMTDLAKRVALVTGGSRGIGRAIAVSLADAGAAVAVNYREKRAEAESVADTIRANGGRAVAIQADVSRADGVTRMMSAVERELGPVDVLVNNAGVGLVRSVDELTEADFDLTIAVNLKSVFLCTQAAIPNMRTRGWGRIVNISSGAARGAGGVGPHYNASKAGMEGMTRGYAARLVKEGITVNAVAPSLIETDMVKQGVASSPARIPLGRFGTPDECALIVMMLVRNGYMTGQTVALSGGMSFL
jgi:3-oxoacyl-[acyl-carrier protein] reductase